MKGDVPRNSEGQIDLPVGTKVKLQGKHCVVTKHDYLLFYELCKYCSLNGRDNTPKCVKIACQECEREDGAQIYFKEI